MSNIAKVDKFDDFRKLRQSVATLIGCQSLLDSGNRRDIDALDALSRKMEVSALVQQREVIAVAGMQGVGKTTFIKNLYGLPDEVLRISSERGEVVPVFVTEKGSLEQGQYTARIVSSVDGKFESEDIEITEIAEKSRRPGDVAYIELFVPYTCFNRDNGGFVLLPGFEKNIQRGFDREYNSLMEYTLHFAKAVILVVDDTVIANEEIDSLLDMLGKNFNPRNCIFVISKCDTKSEQQCHDMKDSLHAICAENGVTIEKQQVVCVGEYPDEQNMDSWKERLLDAIEVHFDYNAAQKDYRYFRPMIDEILECAERVGRALSGVEVELDSLPPVYEELKIALDEAEANFEKQLNIACAEAKQQVLKNFEKAYAKIESKHKSNKKFLIINKKYEEIRESQRIIEENSKACLQAGDRSVLISVYSDKVGSKKQELQEGYNALLLECNQNKTELLPVKELQAESNKAIRYYLDVREDVLPVHATAYHPDTASLAKMMAMEFSTFFNGMLIGNVDLSAVPIRTAGAYSSMNTAIMRGNHGTSIAKAITLIDLLDGKSDILQSVVSLFVKEGAEAAVSAACGVAGVAIAVVAAGKKGLDFYNDSIKAQNAVGEAWEKALMNAVEEQKNSCLDSFHDAAQEVLKYVCRVHNARKHVGEQQQRVAAATYAIADIKQIAARFDDRYAMTI